MAKKKLITNEDLLKELKKMQEGQAQRVPVPYIPYVPYPVAPPCHHHCNCHQCHPPTYLQPWTTTPSFPGYTLTSGGTSVGLTISTLTSLGGNNCG